MITNSLIPEHEINEAQLVQITELRNACFPDHSAPRSYAKQLPHSRYLAFDGNKLIAYTGIDFRVIRLGNFPVTTLGIIDLCVSSEYRSRGIASKMLEDLSVIATESVADFMILFADDSRLYERNGFERKQNTCSWLKIDEHKNHGIGSENLADCLMVKAVASISWSNDDVDLLGYLF